MTRSNSRLRLISLSLAILVYASSSLAAWPSGGAPVGTGSGDQDPSSNGGPTLCHDQIGGVIAAFRTGSNEIRINRLDGVDGDRQWNGTTGHQVSGTAAGPPHVVGDGQGGAWVAWYDTRTTGSGTGLYIQHYDIDGSTLYTPGGIRVSGGAAPDPNGDHIDVDATAEGHLLVAWQGTGVGIWVQRILLSGSFDAFTKVSTDLNMSRVQVVSDGEGSLVVWQCSRAGDQGIWANRASVAGLALWGTQGRQVMNRGSGPAPAQHTIAWDTPHLFVTWSFQPSGARLGLRDVYAQKMSVAGTTSWGTASLGLPVLIAPFVSGITSSPQQHVEPQIVVDGAGGCVIVWRDHRDHFQTNGAGTHGADIYGQRLSSSGIEQWNSNGRAIDDNPGTQAHAKLVPNDLGSGTVVYMSYFGLTRDVWAKKLNASGSAAWTDVIADGNWEEDAPIVAPNGFGGFVAAWEDERGSDTDIYAMHWDASGNPFDPELELFSPNGGEVLLAGTKWDIQWNSNLGANVSLEYQPQFQPSWFPIVSSTPNDGEYEWTVVAASPFSAKLRVLDAAGDLTDESDDYVSICPAPFTGGTASSGFLNARGVATGDFNEDGLLDIAVAVDSELVIARGLGNGSFTSAFSQPLAYPAQDVLVRDFNHDGILDAAVSNGRYVSTLEGSGSGGVGDGGFKAPVDYFLGADLRGLEAADLNDDGITDLVVVDAIADQVTILQGLGTGSVANGAFAVARVEGVPAGPARVVAADFTNDDILDLAVTCEDANTFVVLEGDGSGGVGFGSFPTQHVGGTCTGAKGLAVGDFNEDSALDLAIGNSNTTISICLGLGDGTFTAPVTVDGEGGNGDLVVGDFTADGRADIVAAAGTYNQMTLYRGGGSGDVSDGTFEFVGTYGTGSFPEAIVAADFDHDNQPDLLTANRGTNNVYFLQGNLIGCNGVSSGLSMTYPIGSVQWPIGSTQAITWTADPRIVSVNIEISRDSGLNWQRLATEVVGTSWNWYVSGPTSSTVRIRIVDSLVAGQSDASTSDMELVDVTSVHDSTAPPALLLHAASPNPFNPRTTLRFDLPRSGRVSLRIYDLSGRLVRTVVDSEVLRAGSHARAWNGRDAQGRKVSSGVYSYRLIAGGVTQVKSMVLVK